MIINIYHYTSYVEDIDLDNRFNAYTIKSRFETLSETLKRQEK
jgi:hypothetical protein